MGCTNPLLDETTLRINGYCTFIATIVVDDLDSAKPPTYEIRLVPGVRSTEYAGQRQLLSENPSWRGMVHTSPGTRTIIYVRTFRNRNSLNAFYWTGQTLGKLMDMVFE
jgi:hypothetical protein